MFLRLYITCHMSNDVSIAGGSCATIHESDIRRPTLHGCITFVTGNLPKDLFLVPTPLVIRFGGARVVEPWACCILICKRLSSEFPTLNMTMHMAMANKRTMLVATSDSKSMRTHQLRTLFVRTGHALKQCLRK